MHWTVDTVKRVSELVRQRAWVDLFRECVVSSEILLSEAILSSWARLDEKDRLQIQKAEANIGRGKGINSFGLGEIIRLCPY
jgi:hypothetical protein